MALYILFRIAQVIVLVLPIKLSYWLASRIADLHYYTSKKDRELLLGNLKMVFGKNDLHTRKAARAVIQNFGKYLVEFLRFTKMGKKYIEKNVDMEGLDNIKRALELKKGAVAFSAHLGNWEWGAALIAQLGYPISVIALAHKSKYVNNFFIKQRAIKGVGNIPLGGSVRKSLELLSKNEIIGILSDRDFSNNSVGVKLFGQTAFLPIGIALFAIKSGSPLLPTIIVRGKDGRHKLIIDRPIEYKLTGNKADDIRNIIQKTAESIEKYIKIYPEQWFMFENPWVKK